MKRQYYRVKIRHPEFISGSSIIFYIIIEKAKDIPEGQYPWHAQSPIT
jgi:hypothetical protein